MKKKPIIQLDDCYCCCSTPQKPSCPFPKQCLKFSYFLRMPFPQCSSPSILWWSFPDLHLPANMLYFTTKSGIHLCIHCLMLSCWVHTAPSMNFSTHCILLGSPIPMCPVKHHFLGHRLTDKSNHVWHIFTTHKADCSNNMWLFGVHGI